MDVACHSVTPAGTATRRRGRRPARGVLLSADLDAYAVARGEPIYDSKERGDVRASLTLPLAAGATVWAPFSHCQHGWRVTNNDGGGNVIHVGPSLAGMAPRGNAAYEVVLDGDKAEATYSYRGAGIPGVAIHNPNVGATEVSISVDYQADALAPIRTAQPRSSGGEHQAAQRAGASHGMNVVIVGVD